MCKAFLTQEQVNLIAQVNSRENKQLKREICNKLDNLLVNRYRS